MPLGMEGRREEGEGREGGREGKREIREGALYSWSANKETGCFHKRLFPLRIISTFLFLKTNKAGGI